MTNATLTPARTLTDEVNELIAGLRDRTIKLTDQTRRDIGALMVRAARAYDADALATLADGLVLVSTEYSLRALSGMCEGLASAAYSELKSIPPAINQDEGDVLFDLVARGQFVNTNIQLQSTLRGQYSDTGRLDAVNRVLAGLVAKKLVAEPERLNSVCSRYRVTDGAVAALERYAVEQFRRELAERR
jgi:hypothetical protein